MKRISYILDVKASKSCGRFDVANDFRKEYDWRYMALDEAMNWCKYDTTLFVSVRRVERSEDGNKIVSDITIFTYYNETNVFDKTYKPLLSLLKRYGFTIERIEEDAYIAYNDTYFIPINFLRCSSTPYESPVFGVKAKDFIVNSWLKHFKEKAEIEPGGWSRFGIYAYYAEIPNMFDLFVRDYLGGCHHTLRDFERWLKRLYGEVK